jgi:hypothetical protein
MKYRWLKITGSVVWGTNDLKKEDLARLKQLGYDCILDVQNNTYYDVDTNEWKDIEGDKSVNL